MSNYGIPYMGSKSKICAEVCSLFPKAENFYDLFGGGFSITHFMLKNRSKDFKKFHFNEIRPGMCDLIKDAIAGKYNYNKFLPEWISREDFLRRHETGPYINILWSFGNNGESYLFGKDIEEYKRSMHMAIVFNQFNDKAKEILGMEKFRDGYSIKDRRLLLRDRINFLSKGKPVDQQLQQLQQIERLQQLQQLEQLERLQQLQQLYFYSASYESVLIKENSVIYCDIPYGGTAEYDKNSSFNRKEFFDWADNIKEPVYISEYNVEDNRFFQISAKTKRSLLSPNKDNKLSKSEKVYINRAGYNKLIEKK
jgi:hypothetical protein